LSEQQRRYVFTLDGGGRKVSCLATGPYANEPDLTFHVVAKEVVLFSTEGYLETYCSKVHEDEIQS
jgi:hypothetical protein